MLKSEKPNFKIVTMTESYQVKIPYSKTKVLWVGLFLACMLLFGDAYAFDNPMALQSTIQEEMDLNNIQFNMFYSIYSLPNIILPFFGGIFIDRIGVRISIILFSTILLLGQGIVVIGGYTLAYVTMLAGRGIFGMGSESLNAAQAAIMSQWFHGGQVSLALGLCLSIPKMGSALNSLVSPLVQAQYDSLGLTLLVSLFILIFSWLCGLALVLLDKENEKRLVMYNQFYNTKQMLDKRLEELPKQEEQIEKNVELEQKTDFESEPDAPGSPSNDSQFELQASLLNNTYDEMKEDQSVSEVEHREEVHEQIKLSDLKELDGTYWILASIIMLSEALFVPFLDNGNAFMQVKYGFSQKQAGGLLTIPYIFAAGLTPLVGYYSDKFRQRSLLIVITCATFIVTHLLLLLINCETACGVSSIPLLFLGLCYSFYSAILIPSIPLVVQPKMIGTAFGLVGVLQNTALALFPLITGHIYNSHLINDQGQKDPRQGYEYQSFFFVGVSFINLVVALTLYMFDKNGLKKLSRQRKK